MICIVLAAGYATRLNPLTENFPKPLLPVGEKPLLNWLLEDIDPLPEVTELVVISNHKFIIYFESWAAEQKFTRPIRVLDDGSTDNENRLGAVKDILFAVETLQIQDDILDIFVSTPLEECERRDVKGLYAKARKGEIKNFTGISAPFEIPEHPALSLDTSKLSLEESVNRLLELILPKVKNVK